MSQYFLPAPPSDNERNAPTSMAQLLKLLGLCVLGIAVILWGLSALVNNLVWIIPPEVEHTLGDLVRPTYEAQARPSPQQDTLNDLLDRLEPHLTSDYRERDFQVLYVPEDTVNALAIPGDRIVIFQGLLEAVESENELMMVLGHELGHFVNRDHMRSLVQQMLVPIVIASLWGETSGLAAAGINVADTAASSQISQSQELKADQVGLQLLHDTYGHVGGATDFFARLQASPRHAISFLSTHPVPQRRIDALKRLIQHQGLGTRPTTPLPPSLQGHE